MESIKINGINYTPENIDMLNIPTREVDFWQNSIYYFLKNWFDKTEFITVNTSGSTGKPKEIKLPKTAMRNSAKLTNSFFNLDASKSALLCLPAGYIAGKMMLVRAIMGQFNLICIEPTASPFKHIQQEIDFCAITPYQLSNSLNDLAHLPIKQIIVGGAKINQDSENEIQQIDTRFFETYGMTETCSHIALRALNGPEASEEFQILSGIKIRKNENNCLCITAEKLHATEIITNDIVEIIGENRFRFIGRLDNIINSGGIKIQPEIIEKKIKHLINSPYFIFGIPDNVLGQKIVLYIESSDKSQSARIHESIKNVLSKYEVPKEIHFIDQFEYKNSKISRKKY